MTTRDFFAQATGLLLPLLLALLSLAVAYLVPLINRVAKNRIARDALDALTALAATAVANAAQTVVADMKDPSKPGAWGAVAAAAVKRQVMDDVRRFGAAALAQLGATGMAPDALDALVSQLVEQAVVKLKGDAPLVLMPERLSTLTSDAPTTPPATAARGNPGYLDLRDAVKLYRWVRVWLRGLTLELTGLALGVMLVAVAVGLAGCSGTRLTVGGTGSVTTTPGGDTTWAVGVQVGIQFARRELPAVRTIVDAHTEIPAATRATVDRVMTVAYDSLDLASTALTAYIQHPDPAGQCATYGYVEAAFTGALQGLTLATDAGAPIPPEVGAVVGGLATLDDVLFTNCGPTDAGIRLGASSRAQTALRRLRR